MKLIIKFWNKLYLPLKKQSFTLETLLLVTYPTIDVKT